MKNFENMEQPINQIEQDTLNIREELEKYFRQWKWFVLSSLVTVIAVYFYLRYQPNVYEVSTSVLIKEDQSAMSSELAAFQDIAMLGGGSSSIENEIQILKSRTLASTVAEDLNLTVSYYREGRVKESEVYDEVFELRRETNKINVEKDLDTLIYARISSLNQLELLDVNQNFVAKLSFGESIKFGSDNYYLIQKKPVKFNHLGTTLKIKITPLDKVVSSLIKGINVSPVDKKASVLALSMKSSVKKKAGAILDQWVLNYQTQEIDDKNEVSQNTAFFVGERLKIIRAELSEIDRLVEEYKFNNDLTDIEKESESFINNVSTSEQALFDANTQLKLLSFMKQYLNKEYHNNGLIPSLGFSDASINALVAQYNSIVLERNRVLRNSTANNPLVINYDLQLTNLRLSLQESLNNLEESLSITIKELTRKDNELNSKKSSIPRKEREYRDLVRQQGIKESLYLYLLQKQEETQISLAVTASNSRVIDKAYGSDIPVAPKKKIILLAGLLLGLIIPFVVIYIKDLLDTKLHTRKDLEGIVTTPILGDIPINETKENIVVSKDGRSSTAEAFRLLRTNLDFMLTEKKDTCKTIFLTSTTSGEGKSFVSINLACTLALSGKKVALLGMDLRAPKITEYLGVPNRKGITNFILDDQITLDTLKFSIAGHENVDFYASGAIPPNPAELLMHKRVEELFEKVTSEYDYVIVDTAPVSLVTDTLMLSHYADLFIYIARANYLDKRLLAVPQTLYNEKRLPNMAMLINGSDYKKGYGYGNYGAYGYGYGNQANKPWWKTIFKS
ncbi:GumC family protein [Flavicella marina]|uniref:GumC family protein n=1 Tax=Flavicella marina TaxID=1475951 RepID=UPI00126520B6|nr:tyrosine-protein kinase [Flavicella marina]